MKRSVGEKIAGSLITFFISVLALAAVYPVIYVAAGSLSSKKAIEAASVWLWPIGFNLDSYLKVLGMGQIWSGYMNTVFYTVFGTVSSLLITVCGAYPLSKKRLLGRRVISFLVAATMYVSAGLIPTFLNIRSLGLLNSRIGIVIAFSCQAFFVFVLISYFQTIPDSLEESAKIDGANDLFILWKIILPLSLPSIMTLSLFFAVQRWNGWYWASILLRDIDKMPLQVILRKFVTSLTPSEDLQNLTIGSPLISYQTVLYATIMVSALPIIIVYPFIQKFFVSGIMIGSLKE